MSSIDPTRAQFDAFKALPRDTPIQMLNLVRLKPPGRLSGRPSRPRQGPERAGRLSRLWPHHRPDLFKRPGRSPRSGPARPGDRASPARADERWDLAFIAEYPNAGAFLAMVTNPEYREHVKHRQAAVEDSRLIRFSPFAPGKGFGE